MDTKRGAAFKHHLRLLKAARVFLLIVLSEGVLLVLPASGQSKEEANTRTGSVQGTVVDSNNDPVPGATIVLQGPGGNRLTVVTKDDGAFAFHDVTPGIAYQITISAQGLSEWSSSVTVEPGQPKTLTDVRLRVLTVQRPITVTYSSKEVATQQLKTEEQQRILHFIPNIYVSYEAHPEPLTTGMKFKLAYKDITHPVFFGRAVAWAGVEQGFATPNYPQGARGYGERLGASLADATSEDLIGNAILPALLHQDPRYFYDGAGTKKSRARHAILAAFVCKGDNGAWQPNYSTWGGSLISSSISMAYYPEENRTASHVFRDFGVDMALHIGGSLAQEFILDKFTSRGKH